MIFNTCPALGHFIIAVIVYKALNVLELSYFTDLSIPLTLIGINILIFMFWCNILYPEYIAYLITDMQVKKNQQSSRKSVAGFCEAGCILGNVCLEDWKIKIGLRREIWKGVMLCSEEAV